MANFIRDFVKMHFHYGINRASAGLAYYLAFSFFPLLLFLHSIFALINLSPTTLEQYLYFIPGDIRTIIFDYYLYLSTSDVIIPLILGLILTLYSFTRWVNHLYYIFNSIFNVKYRKRSLITSIIFTVVFMLSIYLLLFLTIIGDFIINFIDNFFILSNDFIWFLQIARYVIAILYMFFIILLLYKYLTRVKLRFKQCVPGAVYAILGIFAASIGFSIYISFFSNYSLIYGSLSTIMLLFLWLYIIGLIIVQGNLINKLILIRKKS